MSAPIDMVLHCPSCGMQHIDAPEAPEPHPAFGPGMDRERWTNPPHRSHLCASCGHIWRPADVPTNGVEAVQTKGSADSTIAPRWLSFGPGAPIEYVPPGPLQWEEGNE